MSKLVKTIFDTCIAKIDEQKRTSILDQLYADSKQTRAVFLAQAEEVAKTTFEAKESLAKIYSFAEYLKKQKVVYIVKFNDATTSSFDSLNGKGQSINLKNFEYKVYAKNAEAAEQTAIDELWDFYGIEAHDVDINNVKEMPVKNEKGFNNFRYEVA